MILTFCRCGVVVFIYGPILMGRGLIWFGRFKQKDF